MLIDTFVYSLSFTSALPLLFRSVLSTEQLEKVILLSKEIYVGDCILLTKNTQKIFLSATFVWHIGVTRQ